MISVNDWTVPVRPAGMYTLLVIALPVQLGSSRLSMYTEWAAGECPKSRLMSGAPDPREMVRRPDFRPCVTTSSRSSAECRRTASPYNCVRVVMSN